METINKDSHQVSIIRIKLIILTKTSKELSLHYRA